MATFLTRCYRCLVMLQFLSLLRAVLHKLSNQRLTKTPVLTILSQLWHNTCSPSVTH